jgi:hypothetical protein
VESKAKLDKSVKECQDLNRKLNDLSVANANLNCELQQLRVKAIALQREKGECELQLREATNAAATTRAQLLNSQ